MNKLGMGLFLWVGGHLWRVFFFFLVFCLSRAVPEVYGGSQPRDQIGAAAASLHHSTGQRWIFNPLSEARYPTCVLMVTSRVC